MDKYNLLDAVAAEAIDPCPAEAWPELEKDLDGDGEKQQEHVPSRPAPEARQTEIERREDPAPEPPPAEPARPLTVPGRPAPQAPRRPARPAPAEPAEPDPFVPARSPERDEAPLSPPDWRPLGRPIVPEPGQSQEFGENRGPT